MRLRSARIIAATFALAAFCIAAMTGVLVGNPPAAVLLRALAAMGVCWIVGALVGEIAQHLVTRELAAHRLRNPVENVVLPGEDDEAMEDATAGDEDILVV